jgi:CRP-like cAMP-binding protein
MTMSEAVAEALGVEPELLSTADVRIEARSLGPNEVLIRRGDPAAEVFVVLRGSVEVLGFDDQPLVELESGSVVGEVAVLAGSSVPTATPIASLPPTSH